MEPDFYAAYLYLQQIFILQKPIDDKLLSLTLSDASPSRFKCGNNHRVALTFSQSKGARRAITARFPKNLAANKK
jgi:hypothetical protein